MYDQNYLEGSSTFVRGDTHKHTHASIQTHTESHAPPPPLASLRQDLIKGGKNSHLYQDLEAEGRTFENLYHLPL